MHTSEAQSHYLYILIYNYYYRAVFFYLSGPQCENRHFRARMSDGGFAHFQSERAIAQSQTSRSNKRTHRHVVSALIQLAAQYDAPFELWTCKT